MPKFFGKVGYGNSIEEPSGSGIWVDQIVEYAYYGDILRNTRRLEQGEQLNSNVVVDNYISIVADQFANENFSDIRYIQWAGTLWTVTNVEVQRPRLLLTLGSVYNGPTQ